MKTLFKTAVLLAIGTFALPFSASAIPVTYATRAAFDTAAGATTLIDFEAQNYNGDSGYVWYNSSLAVGPVTFTEPSGRLFVLGKSVYSTTGVTSDYLNNNSGTGAVGAAFSSPVYSVGFDIGYVFPWGGGGFGPRSLIATLSTGDTFTLTVPELNLTGNSFSFFGFTSDVGITSLSFADPTDGMALDNFAYSTVASSVPDGGSTLAMLGLALTGVAGLRRKFGV